MTVRATTARTAGYALLALLFALAAVAFAQRAIDAWGTGRTAHLTLGVLVTLGMVSLCVGSLRRARQASRASG